MGVRGLQGGSPLSFHQQLSTCQNLPGIYTCVYTYIYIWWVKGQLFSIFVLVNFKVTWQKLVNGTKQNVAIANPSLGVSVAPPYKDRVAFKNAAVRRRTPNLEDTTITFSSLRLTDESTYICEYTTFPAGNRENTVNLSVYGETGAAWHKS